MSFYWLSWVFIGDNSVLSGDYGFILAIMCFHWLLCVLM